MLKFIVGIIFGIMVCTVGFSGLAQILDNGVSKVQSVAKDIAK